MILAVAGFRYTLYCWWWRIRGWEGRSYDRRVLTLCLAMIHPFQLMPSNDCITPGQVTSNPQSDKCSHLAWTRMVQVRMLMWTYIWEHIACESAVCLLLRRLDKNWGNFTHSYCLSLKPSLAQYKYRLISAFKWMPHNLKPYYSRCKAVLLISNASYFRSLPLLSIKICRLD